MSKREEAENKIRNEMNNKEGYVQIISQYLLSLVEQSEENAEAVLKNDCSIKKSIDAMKAEAKKKSKNGIAVMTDEEGFKIIRKYYCIGIDKETSKVINLDAHRKEPEVALDIDLDSFLK